MTTSAISRCRTQKTGRHLIGGPGRPPRSSGREMGVGGRSAGSASGPMTRHLRMAAPVVLFFSLCGASSDTIGSCQPCTLQLYLCANTVPCCVPRAVCPVLSHRGTTRDACPRNAGILHQAKGVCGLLRRNSEPVPCNRNASNRAKRVKEQRVGRGRTGRGTDSQKKTKKKVAPPERRSPGRKFGPLRQEYLRQYNEQAGSTVCSSALLGLVVGLRNGQDCESA